MPRTRHGVGATGPMTLLGKLLEGWKLAIAQRTDRQPKIRVCNTKESCSSCCRCEPALGPCQVLQLYMVFSIEDSGKVEADRLEVSFFVNGWSLSRIELDLEMPSSVLD